MRLTFDQAIEQSATEFHLLRERAENKTAFDQAVERMRTERWTCNVKTGATRNRDGIMAKFTAYDWSDNYAERPETIFNDYFAGSLMNKYSRLMRGLDA
jgi:hypothetical protein